MDSQALTVLFADIAGSTRLYQMQGDVRAHQRVSQSLQSMKLSIEQHGGTLLRTVGDSALASFAQTDGACEAAMDIQREHLQLGLTARVGFHFGEVIADSGDIYGNAVNLAARIAAFAEANEICTTDTAIARLGHKHRTNVHFLDKVEFKGLSKPISVYRVHWRTDSAQTLVVTAGAANERFKHDKVLELQVDGKQLRIDAGNPVMTFGRSYDNDVVIESESASRNHASIEWARGRYVLNDFSTNGTYVLKDGMESEFLRRESVPLDQSGVIGLGFDPMGESLNIINYRLLSADSR